jgi:transposase
LTPQQLFGWRRAALRPNGEADGSGSAFAPVIVDTASPSAAAAMLRPSGSPVIEIVIGAATVRILPGTDAATLQTVLRAVKAAT